MQQNLKLQVTFNMSAAALFGRTDKRQLWFWLIYLSIALVLWLIIGVWLPHQRHVRQVVQTRQNLHAIQLGLERYAVDNEAGNYPGTIDELIVCGYFSKLPENPFTREPMRALPPDAPDSPGDFRYIPLGDDGSSRAPVVRYELTTSF